MMRRSLSAAQPKIATPSVVPPVRFSRTTTLPSPTSTVVLIQGQSPTISEGFSHYMTKALQNSGASILSIGNANENVTLASLAYELSRFVASGSVTGSITVLLSAHAFEASSPMIPPNNFNLYYRMMNLGPYPPAHHVRLNELELTPTSAVLAVCTRTLGSRISFLLLADDYSEVVENDYDSRSIVPMKRDDLLDALTHCVPTDLSPAGLLGCYAAYHGRPITRQTVKL